MSYLITFSIILSFAITLSILFKKRIEEVIIIGIVEIVIIMFAAGLLDNLKAGIILVEILAVFQLIFIIAQIIKKKKQGNVKELIKNIFTPGLSLYALLFIVSTIINKDRVFEDYDEFSHWAVITKNMFVYNTYGINAETIVRFNDYPPFTALFQYLFVGIKGAYVEHIVLVAQNVLYFSIILPITKHINWDKSLKKLVAIVPIIIFVPMIFYKNFYLDILVDGLLGVMFAYTIFSSFEKEQNAIFKYTRILIGSIMLCLTKTSGIALAILAVIIIFIKSIIDRKNDKHNFKKEIKLIIGIILITLILTSLWYIKVNQAEKMWDFTESKTEKEEQKEIAKIFVNGVLSEQIITERGFSVIGITLIYIGFQLYAVQKNKIDGYKYYSNAMIISIPIYLLALLISYATIFTTIEARILACFDRYTSTILLAYPIFQAFVMSRKY